MFLGQAADQLYFPKGSLYCTYTFMDRDEFGEMFDLALYEKVRAKYGADEHFHHLFDKTSGCQSYDFQDMLDEESKKKKV